jgi:2'-5' RNA ligase
MRSFIAIDVSNELVCKVLEELKKVNADIKIVEPQNLHITLKFLGEIREELVDSIYEAMLPLADFPSFNLSMEGVGTFPSPKYIRVIWIGIRENRKKIVEMQQSLEERLIKLGFKKESRKFDPHLTICRVKSPHGKDELLRFIEKNRNREFGKVYIDKVYLKKSTLTPKGPIYSTIKTIHLREERPQG